MTNRTDLETVLALIDDPILRERVRSAFIAEVGHNTNQVQLKVFEIGDNVNNRLDGIVLRQETAYSDMYNIINTLVSEVRGSRGELTHLGSMFQGFAERFLSLEETVKAHDDRLAHLDSDMVESKTDRQLIHQEVNEVLQQVEALAVTIGQLVERNKAVDSMLPLGADRDKMLHRLIAFLSDHGE